MNFTAVIREDIVITLEADSEIYARHLLNNILENGINDKSCHYSENKIILAEVDSTEGAGIELISLLSIDEDDNETVYPIKNGYKPLETE